MATQGISPKRWVPLVAALVLIAAGAVGWMLFRRAPEGEPQVADQTVAGTPTPAPTPDLVETSATPVPTPAAERPLQPTPTPANQENPRDRGQLPQPPPSTPSPRREPPLVDTRPTPTPAPVQPVPTPAPAEPQRPQAEEPAPAEPEPSRPLPSADRTVRSGLSLAFRVTPPDALVLVDRTVIGQARKWSGEKGAQPYTLPSPGEYLIRIKKDGMKEYRIAVQASETGGVTPIFAQLSPMPAAEVEAGDLKTVRVSEAVAFRVRPPGAVILVDGQLVGPALKYNGGLRGGWLRLPPGRHRVSIQARGHRQQDLIVEVMPGAIQEREKIDVNLFQGGGD